MGWNLAELIQRHTVPGAQVAVLVNGEIEEYVTGVPSLRTRIETTALGKLPVNDGVLDLDCPIRSYLPDSELDDALARIA